MSFFWGQTVWLHHLPAVWPWITDLIHLGLSFLVFEMGAIIVPPPYRICGRRLDDLKCAKCLAHDKHLLLSSFFFIILAMPCGLWDLSSPSRDLITREFLSSLFILSLLLLLEKEMTAHSNILAWKIPWTAEPATVYGITKSRTPLSNFTYYSFKGRWGWHFSGELRAEARERFLYK